jgi:hypothetical protein
VGSDTFRAHLFRAWGSFRLFLSCFGFSSPVLVFSSSSGHFAASLGLSQPFGAFHGSFGLFIARLGFLWLVWDFYSSLGHFAAFRGLERPAEGFDKDVEAHSPVSGLLRSEYRFRRRIQREGSSVLRMAQTTSSGSEDWM